MRCASRFVVLIACYCLAGTFGFALNGCEWQPVARSVQPDRILDGPTRVEMVLDSGGRFVLVTQLGEDGNRLSIVDWNTHRACMLPAETRRIEVPLRPPSSGSRAGPRFFMPIAIQEGDVRVLRFADERCVIYGDYGPVSANTSRMALDEDGREVLLFGNGMGTVTLADPWRGQQRVLAERVTLFVPVSRKGPPEPQLLWFVEEGQLRQRTLDGTLLFSIGTMVTSLVQGVYDTLRVAYVDQGDLYEAVAPTFEPVLIGQGACEPAYRGDALDRLEPCAARQLVRFGLYTGQTEQFEPGVYSAYTDSGLQFEYARDEARKLQLFVKPVGKPRVEITPAAVQRPVVISPTQIAGVAECTTIDPNDAPTLDGSKEPIGCERDELSLIVWSLEGDKLRKARVLDRIIELLPPYFDQRSSSFLWLVHHWTSAEGGEPVRTLSLFSERTLTAEPIATHTSLRDPLRNGRAARGYSVEGLAAYPEPLLIYINDATPVTSTPELSRGTLNVQLLRGGLGSSVDENVSSYVMVATPLLGVVYGVEEGDNVGLWFAAL